MLVLSETLWLVSSHTHTRARRHTHLQRDPSFQHLPNCFFRVSFFLLKAEEVIYKSVCLCVFVFSCGARSPKRGLLFISLPPLFWKCCSTGLEDGGERVLKSGVAWWQTDERTETRRKVALKAVALDVLSAAPSVLTFDMVAHVLPSVCWINNLTLKRAKSLVIALLWRFYCMWVRLKTSSWLATQQGWSDLEQTFLCRF